jgi:peptidoglycan/xylan/chitin deacetylase (PgdA/CDA1 family)
MSPKHIFIKLLRYSGLPFLFRELIQRRRVSIVLFHDLSPEEARMAFTYLSEKYRIISLKDYVDHLEGKGEGKLPPKAMVLTFDDGHIGNFALLPLIKKLDLPLTIFLCSGIVGTKRHFWFTCETEGLEKSALKKLPNREKLALLEKAGFRVDREFGSPQALTKEQVERMKPWVDFQAHTVFHPCLPTCTEEEARWEIGQSKEALERDFGLPIYSIAFPNGDYSERDIELCRQAGYRSALTVDYGFNSLREDPFRLKRLSVDSFNNLDELVVKASGVWGFFKTLNGSKQSYGKAEPLAG